MAWFLRGLPDFLGQCPVSSRLGQRRGKPIPRRSFGLDSNSSLNIRQICSTDLQTTLDITT